MAEPLRQGADPGDPRTASSVTSQTGRRTVAIMGTRTQTAQSPAGACGGDRN